MQGRASPATTRFRLPTQPSSLHVVSQSEAEQVFFDPRLLMVADPDHSNDEMRFHALGRTIGGRRLHVTFTLRESETLSRVISARDMHRKERNFYDRKD
jgi:hypothetical protein